MWHKMLVLIGTALVGGTWGMGAACAQEKEKNPEEGKKGTTVGILVEKGKDALFVRGDGEEKPRRFIPQWKGGMPAQGGGLDKDMLKVFAKLEVGSRIEVSWVFEERLRALHVKVLAGPKGDKKAGGDKKESAGKDKEVKKGSVTGVLTGKGKNFIEVKGDGEESARKYFLHFGGNKKLLDVLNNTPLRARVRIDWIHLEHFRVVDLEPLRPAEKN